MTLYDDAAVQYDEALVLYDGVQIDADLSLLVGGQDVTGYLADRGLSVTVNNHGNSLGNLDATLIDPASTPSLDDEVRLFIGAVSRYLGSLKSLDVDEYRGGHLFVGFGAQDSGPEEGAIPTAAPFAISDDPDGVNSFGYERLRKRVSNTDGGTTKTTYEMVVGRDGLWIDMNVDVTAANYGLSATELTIKKATVRWRTPDSPEYVLELGDPTVSMAQVIAEAGFVPDGSITETKISDGAISTPKLAAGAITTEKLDADAVIANVANVGDTVVIDSDGIAVTDGEITVTNGSGTVVIDGTSNMFKIAATGTASRTIAKAGSGWTDTTVSGPFSSTPAHLSFVSTTNTNSGERAIGRQITLGAPVPTDYPIQAVMDVTTSLSGTDCRVRFGGFNSNNASGSITWYCKFYVMKEAAI